MLDGEQRAALAIVRSLGRGGYAVHVGSSVPNPLAGGSRRAMSETILPDPLGGTDAYTTAVCKLIAEKHAEILIPVTEASTLALLERPELFARVRIPTSDLTHFRRATDKAAVLELACGLGIDVPSQWTTSSETLPHLSIPRNQFPLVIKPSRSVVGPEGRRRKVGVSYAHSREELTRAIAEHGPEPVPLLIQNRIEGPGLGVFMLRWGGKVLATFAHRRIREKPPSGGVSVCSESVAAPPELIALSESLLSALDWSGVAMIEYKHDTRSGKTYLMEVNPRFWGSLQLAVDAGVDFPRLLVEVMLGRNVVPVKIWRVGVRSRWRWGEIDCLISRLRHSRRELNLPPDAPGVFRAALSALTPWWPGTRSDVFRFSDPLPSLREAIAWMRAL